MVELVGLGGHGHQGCFSTKFIEISTMFEEEETSDPLVSQILVFSLKKFVC